MAAIPVSVLLSRELLVVVHLYCLNSPALLSSTHVYGRTQLISAGEKCQLRSCPPAPRHNAGREVVEARNQGLQDEELKRRLGSRPPTASMKVQDEILRPAVGMEQRHEAVTAVFGGGDYRRGMPGICCVWNGEDGGCQWGMRRRRAGRRPSRRGELGHQRGSLGRASAQRRGRLVRPAAQGPLVVTWKAGGIGAYRLRGKNRGVGHAGGGEGSSAQIPSDEVVGAHGGRPAAAREQSSEGAAGVETRAGGARETRAAALGKLRRKHAGARNGGTQGQSRAAVRRGIPWRRRAGAIHGSLSGVQVVC
jgi:hypothetical protein